MNKSDFEEEIRKSGKLVYTNYGDSMEPLIRQGRDVIVVSAVSGRLKKYDVPLYRRDSGQYVLHRILKVRSKDYVICGDNRWNRETGITDSHIIGVLTSVIRDGKKEIPVNDKRYLLYVHLWCDLFWIRCAVLRIRSVFIRALKKIKA